MKKLLLVGAGYMAKEYVPVLQALEIDFEVVCRSEKSAENFKKETGIHCHFGGVEALNQQLSTFSHAIVATDLPTLASVTKTIIKAGIQTILLEKPGGLNPAEIHDLFAFSQQSNSSIFIAYNRRFYSSTEHAKNIIVADGGLLSARFEFTEWPHTIEPIVSNQEVLKNWFLANSSHVVDLAFHLIGKPTSWSAFTGKSEIWNTTAIFSGAGNTEYDVTFSYGSNWLSAGRWSLELLTSKRKLILCPMEQLIEQLIGTVAVQAVAINDELDKKFKPGLFNQTRAFLENDFKILKTINEQIRDLGIFETMIQGS